MWRQVLRKLGSDPDVLLGPSHDARLAEEKPEFPEKREDAIKFLTDLFDRKICDHMEQEPPPATGLGVDALAAIAYDYLMPPRPRADDDEPANSPMTKQAYRFMHANDASPVVSGSAKLLDGKGGNGGFYTLESGETWELSLEDCRALLPGYPKWVHDDPTLAKPKVEWEQRDVLPKGHVIIEQADRMDGRVSQTVQTDKGEEYERIVHAEEAYGPQEPDDIVDEPGV